jgi:hypothetical protein
MKLTRYNLKKLIENYLNVNEENPFEDLEEPEEEEEVEEEPEEEEEVEEEPEEEPEDTEESEEPEEEPEDKFKLTLKDIDIEDVGKGNLKIKDNIVKKFTITTPRKKSYTLITGDEKEDEKRLNAFLKLSNDRVDNDKLTQAIANLLNKNIEYVKRSPVLSKDRDDLIALLKQKLS